MTLPDFIPPMLAKSGEIFDSDDHVFEIKWDGTRAVSFVESGGYRMINRQRNVLTERYPEFEFLSGLPEGTVLDGEVTIFDGDGRPQFRLMLKREQGRGERRIAQLVQQYPGTYVVFDLLYDGGESVMNRPLRERRERLQELVEAHPHPQLVFSDGIVGQGTAYFEQAESKELEGVVAKRLSSKYIPGKRSDAWTKVKRRHQLPCAVVGFLPDGEKAVRSLVLGAQVDGELRPVGRVGSGLTAAQRRALRRKFDACLRDAPFIPVRHPEALWVDPGFYCTVSYLEWTADGQLRAPVFEGLIDG
ncbi:MAG: hypothetical protein AAF488_01075 [Planctomycetota bacterium]